MGDDYKFLLIILAFALTLAASPLAATYLEWRERRRREELAKKLHL